MRNVEVFDLAGKRINLKVNNNMLNIRDLSSGLYLVNIETEGRNFTKKFIKK
ncbi:T9SS type A sorting domain-containing protein [Paraburkholderia sp. SIMBA_030]|uniref:T9SS type A sorting domain-containing protein n=1 Tax=Paraburkholderia sp. SIMBA_030 TaxID=3085773 RepID=UPI00397DBB82